MFLADFFYKSLANDIYRCYNKTMEIRYDKEKLKETLTDIYTLLKTPISIFDSNLECIVSNDKMTEYCAKIREDKNRYKKCRECDIGACIKCRESKQTFTYMCHGRVHETITPILIGHRIIGYIIFGQYRIDSRDDEIVRYAEELGMDAEDMLEAYRDLPILTCEQIDAVCNVLKSCILNFTVSNAITLEQSVLADEIRCYIDDNIGEKLTAKILCSRFFINRQQLYTLFYKNFGTTVKDYVLSRKLERAKHLLRSTPLSVMSIAEQCGFPDYNYFIRLFKKHTGKTPLQFRKMTSTIKPPEALC